MADESGADIYIAIAQRLQERFETYWLGLIFTLLALSIQSARFGAVPLADLAEVLAWLLLLVAGLVGLSRFEYIPEIYRLHSLQVGFEERARAVQKEIIRGVHELYVAPLGKTVRSAEYMAESEASARTVEQRLEPIERRQMWKYRLKKRTFVTATCLLLFARSFPPVVGIFHAAHGEVVMTQQLLNRLGLALGFVGVILIFVWGPPQPTFEEGEGLGLEEGTRLEDGRTVAEHDADKRRLKLRHAVLSRIGLALIAVGFAMQFAATY